jgi:hypothetical protein
MMSIYDYLKQNKKEVLFVDRTGNLLAVYCKNDIKILFEFSNIHAASRKLTQFRRDLEDKKVG